MTTLQAKADLLWSLPLDKIDPSPFQPRHHFDPAKLRQLADDICLNGLLQPVTCRPVGERFELICGERRVRAARLIPGQHDIEAKLVEVDDLTARRMCYAENIQRDDLSQVEEAEAVMLWLDSSMQADVEYASQGKDAVTRVAWLLTKLDSDYKHHTDYFGHRFMSQVEAAFKQLPKPITWRSYYVNDLPCVTKLSKEVKRLAAEMKLNKSQAKALQQVQDEAPEIFEKITESGTLSLFDTDTGQTEEVSVEDASAREIAGLVKSPNSVHVHVAEATGEQEWYTPGEYIEAARQVMGEIDCDPATSEIAQRTVKAAVYYTAETDGLRHDWPGRVWLNPPYAAGMVDAFAARLADQVRAGWTKQAIVLVNNATETNWFGSLIDVAGAVVFPKGRVRFLQPAGEQGAPLQGQAVVYVGEAVDLFLSVFVAFGWGCRIERD